MKQFWLGLGMGLGLALIVAPLHGQPPGSGVTRIPAPRDATYLTQTPNNILTNEQALSLLSTGIMQVAFGTGVVTSLVPTEDSVLVGAGSGWQVRPLTDCQGANKGLSYTASSNTWGCTTMSAGGISATTSILRGDGAGNAAAGTVTSADVDNSIALTGVDISVGYAVTATHLTDPLPQSQGGTGVSSITPAVSGTRYLCINTAGVIASSASACSGS